MNDLGTVCLITTNKEGTMKQSIFITGSTKGIGKAIAIEALKANYYVYLNYVHDDKGAQKCADDLDDLGYSGSYNIIKADISSIESIPTILGQMDLDNHPLYGLVLNSSSNGKIRNSFGNITQEELEEMFQMNLFTPFFLVQSMVNYMIDGGSIAFISSNVGVYPHSTYIPYGLTKSSEIFLAKMLVKELAPRKITVNTVAPAFIETDMFPGKRTEEHLTSIRRKVAVHRFGKPEEVARATMSLLTNPYINGAVLSVDGGYNFE